MPNSSRIALAKAGCPLCESSDHQHFYSDKKRDYWQCQACQLIFVDRDQLLTATEEKAIYDLHQNDPNDAGYRQFLNRLVEPLLLKLQPNSSGLDFGCGPGPTLHLMLEEAGHDVSLYDLYYYPDRCVLSQQYDFISSTEVIEHFYSPKNEWLLWLNMLKPQGWLGLMTKLATGCPDDFHHWHYKNDPTHICFFSQTTFRWLATQYDLSVEFIGRDIILMQRL